MICPKCGAKTADSDNFCEDCGASLQKTAIKGNTLEDCGKDSMSQVEVVDASLAMGCNIGRKHPYNEDAGTVIRCMNGKVVMVVSDGVTSAVNSVSASVHTINKVKEVFSERLGDDADLIKTAINEANEIILNLPYETRPDGIYGPEATIVVASVMENSATEGNSVTEGTSVTIGWVGDSRAYIIDKTGQKLLTTDDSWIELVVASGEMSRDEAVKDGRAHYVTQVLGMHDQPMEVHTLKQELEKGQMLLLCTDGLWNYFQDDGDLYKAVSGFGMEKDAKDICEHLIGLANDAGGHDNITVSVYKNY